MPIEHGRGGTTVTGDSVTFLQIVAQRGAVGLEMKGIGVGRGRKLWTRLRDHYSIPSSKKGRKATIEDVYNWLCVKVDELRPQQEHVVEGRRFVGGQEVQ